MVGSSSVSVGSGKDLEQGVCPKAVVESSPQISFCISFAASRLAGDFYPSINPPFWQLIMAANLAVTKELSKQQFEHQFLSDMCHRMLRAKANHRVEHV